jgi:hypothetical protein
MDPGRTIGEGSTLEGARIAAVGSGNLYVTWWGRDGSRSLPGPRQPELGVVRNVSGNQAGEIR